MAMKTKGIEIAQESYIKQAVSALNDLLVISLQRDGLVSVETEVRILFAKGRQYDHSNIAVPIPKKANPKPLKKRK
jgi:hypothetical protein